MFYLIKETMGRKRCIATSDKNTFSDNQFFDCMKSYPFDESKIKYLLTVTIQCINAPGKPTEADVYSD